MSAVGSATQSAAESVPVSTFHSAAPAAAPTRRHLPAFQPHLRSKLNLNLSHVVALANR